MNRLFVRIFLWFWLGSTSLLLVFVLGLLVLQPGVVTTWRALAQTAMLHLGTQVAEAFEREGREPARVLLTNLTRDRFRVWLYSADGRPIGDAAPLTDAQDLVTRVLAGDDVERGSGTDAFILARRVTSASGNQYVFVWQAPLRPQMPLDISPLRLATRVGALILTGGIVCWWLTWQITKPIRTLRLAARRFSEGDLATRVSGRKELSRGDELSELAREFDQMAARIEELLTAQQQLLADISHELRSPLARLSLALDLARRRLGDSVPEYQRIEREIQRLNELIGQLLTLARLQGQSKPDSLPSDTVNLRDLVREVAQDARFEAEATGRTVVLAHDVDTTIRGSRALLRSAIENVVRNAVRHTPEDSAVTITMEQRDEPRRLAIIVRDYGPGVSTQALNRLFDPFYRADEARSPSDGGVGLGLAITRQAMLVHGGNASALNHPDGGLLVQLELPI